ncbi:MAG: hypothetical protein CVU17_07945 [Betaproteobacteria bacterium HGW-Betaproteobacteria-11]|nr:MAG: hypothetical protein CVU17_07945 [Betaproteobacteria bacterium HGW-Betaproteobacteria-11]
MIPLIRPATPAASPVMIAHALGTVDDLTYTDSREAFAASVRRGFRWFEVDLVETRDGRLVACHTLGPLTKELGSTLHIGELTHQQFMAGRLYGRYTPLDLEGVLALVEQHPEIRLILDVKNSANRIQDDDLGHSPEAYRRIHRKIWAALKSRTPEVIGRVYPQLYAPADADILRREAGYVHWIFTTYRFHAADQEIIAAAARDPQMVAVAFEKKRFRQATAERLRVLGKGIWIFVVNEEDQASTLTSLGADGFYTDFLPADFAPSP